MNLSICRIGVALGFSRIPEPGGHMFKRILVPTDGSDLSAAAAGKAIEFAKSVQASVIGFHAAPASAYSYSAMEFSPSLTITRENAEQAGRAFLSIIEDQAREAGVPCESVLEFSSSPYRAIIDTAQAHRCDLIFMGSHGRGAVSSLFMGSVTQHVMSHSFIPVLVYRDERIAAKMRHVIEEVRDYRI
jgi:nucleotide-binding universal stress UspA family protein